MENKIILNKAINKVGKMYIVSPFKQSNIYKVDYPDKGTKSNKLFNIESDIANIFLEFARKNYPNIALGVAFQFMGGLRRGEVVNLTVDSIELDDKKKYLKVDIKDRQDELFYDRNVKTNTSQVKKERLGQPVFNFNSELYEIWTEHLKYRALNRRDNTKALFIDAKGNPMSGITYYRNFTKLKSDFINFLEGESYEGLVNLFTKKRWSTHIGRHIFTNHLKEKGCLDMYDKSSQARQLMILRGDSSVQSAEDYIDKTRIIENVTKQINKVSKIANK